MEAGFVPWVFVAIMTVGVAYLILNMVLGELFNSDVDHGHFHLDLGSHIDLDLNLNDLDTGGADANGQGVGCSTIAAFLAGFGAMGLFGSLSGWHILVSILVALVFGVVLGRAVIAILKLVYRQQSTAVITSSDLTGAVARVTVNIPAGKTGEAMLEGAQRMKYAIRNVADAPLQKGDYVEVVEVKQGRLYVKKKRGQSPDSDSST